MNNHYARVMWPGIMAALSALFSVTALRLVLACCQIDCVDLPRRILGLFRSSVSLMAYVFTSLLACFGGKQNDHKNFHLYLRLFFSGIIPYKHKVAQFI